MTEATTADQHEPFTKSRPHLPEDLSGRRVTRTGEDKIDPTVVAVAVISLCALIAIIAIIQEILNR